MKINSNKMWAAGFVVALMTMFSIGETTKPLTENDMYGVMGVAFMIVGLCIEKEK